MNEPVPAHPSDVIVGSWRLPAAIRRVPPLVWVFAAAALLDAAVRTMLDAGFQEVSGNPLLAIPRLISYLPPAGLLLMPGAVLLGRWTGFAGRAALAGAILLAVSELVALALRVIPFESVFPPAPQDVDTFGGLLAPVRVVDGVLYLGGLLLLLWAAVVARTGVPGIRARVVAAGLVVVAVASAIEVVWMLVVSVRATPPDANGFSIGMPDLASAAIGAAAVVVWGVLAAVATLGRSAARDRRLGWTALAVGAALVVVTQATSDLMSAAVMLGLVTPSSEGPYLDLLRVSGALYPAAAALVLIGLAVGLTDRRAGPPLRGWHEPEPEPAG